MYQTPMRLWGINYFSLLNTILMWEIRWRDKRKARKKKERTNGRNFFHFSGKELLRYFSTAGNEEGDEEEEFAVAVHAVNNVVFVFFCPRERGRRAKETAKKYRRSKTHDRWKAFAHDEEKNSRFVMVNVDADKTEGIETEKKNKKQSPDSWEGNNFSAVPRPS